MKQMRKRGLSLLLTLVMLVGLFPTAALAAEEQTEPTPVTQGEPAPQSEESATPTEENGASDGSGSEGEQPEALAAPELAFYTREKRGTKIKDLSSVTYGSCYLQVGGSEGTGYYYVTEEENAGITAAEVKEKGEVYSARVDMSNKLADLGGTLYVYAAAEKDGIYSAVTACTLTINQLPAGTNSTAARAADGTVYSNGLYCGETAVVTWKPSSKVAYREGMSFWYQVGDGTETQATSVSDGTATIYIPYEKDRDSVTVNLWYTVTAGAEVRTSVKKTATLNWKRDESTASVFTVANADGEEKQTFSGSQVNRLMEYIQSQKLENATIRLDQDFSSSEYSTLIKVPAGVSVTLDLNGHTFATESRRGGMNAIDIGSTSGGTAAMTIKDSSEGKTGLFNSIYPIFVYKDGTLNVDGIKFVQENEGTIIYVYAGATCVVNGGSFRHGGAAIAHTGGGSTAATVTVNGASFDGPLNTSTAFKPYTGGNWTLNDVTVKTVGVAIETDGGTSTAPITVNSGSYETSGDTVIKGAVNVQGGTFAANNSDPYTAFSPYAAIATPENQMLMYSQEDQCFKLQTPPDAEKSGSLTVTPAGGNAQTFTDATDAFAKANEKGGTVQLTEDTALLNSVSGITVTGDVTLDLNGHSLTLDPLKISESAGCLHIANGGKLTIQDSSEGQNGKLNLNKAYGITLAETNDSGKAVLNVQSGTIVGKKAAVYAYNKGAGQVNISGGTLTADSYAVYMQDDSENGGDTAALNVTGGVLSATSQSAIYTYGIKASVTGGVVKANGHAAIHAYVSDLTIAGNAELVTTGDAQDGVLAIWWANSLATLGGNAYIHTDSNVASAINMYYAYNANVTIQGNVRLESGARILTMDESPATIKVNGGHFKYGTVPFSDSRTVTYKTQGDDTYIINTKTNTEGDYVGYYDLVTRDSLTYKDEYGIERKYQDLDALVTAIKNAQAVLEDSSKYTSDSVTKLQTALADAMKLVELKDDGTFVSVNPNANQNEIDYYAAALTDARNTLKGSSELDPAHLADGTYSVSIAMRKAGSTNLSMAAGAVSTNANLIVKDGKAELQLSFQPMYMLSLWGHMLHMWAYNGNTIAEARTNMQGFNGDLNTIGSYANELTPIKWYTVDSTINNIVECTEEHDHAAALSTAKPTCYPWVVSMPLNYLDKSSEANSTYCARVAVDMMRSMNIGDQNVDVFIQWETLTAVSLKPTLSVDTTEVSLTTAAGYNTQTVTADLKNADGYTLRWVSTDTSVAVVDQNGKITAVGGGSTTVTVTASKDGAETLTKTISVTVAGSAAPTPVQVTGTTVENGVVSAKLKGGILVSVPTSGVTSNGSIVTVSAKANGEGITAVNVTIPVATAAALAGKTTVVETNLGSVIVDSALMAEIAKQTGDVTLTVTAATVPSGLGTFTAAYELTLTSGGKDVSFGSGKATVTVPSTEAVKFAYCVKDGKLSERVSATYDSTAQTVAWTTSHFSTWALSAREYETGGTSGGTSGGSVPSTGFFLDNGNYYVTIYLWKATSDEVSMGDVAFKNNRKALVTVEDGKITDVQIATNPVDVDQYHSAIVELKVNGKSVSADEEDSLVTKPAGKTYQYIKRATFTMPGDGQPDNSKSVTYVDVHFTVPDTPMDTVVESLDARLKFVWRTAKKTSDKTISANDSAAKGTSSLTGQTVQDIDLTDKTTGIKLTTDTNRLSDKAELKVEKINSGSSYGAAVKAMNGEKNAWALYSITAQVDGKDTAPKGQVTLSIPCGKDGLAVYRINTTGTKVVLKGEVKDGYYVLNTSSLGLFAVVGELGEAKPVSDLGFTDVLEGAWYYDAVKYVKEKGLFNGTSATTFSPNRTMTRAMLVTVLHRLDGTAANASGVSFSDVPAGQYYTNAVAWAASNGIVSGYSKTVFGPDNSITREQLAAILYRYAKSKGYDMSKTADLSVYTDAGTVSGFASDAMSWAVGNGLINGTSATTLSPKGTATRAQVATILMRFAQLSESK